MICARVGCTDEGQWFPVIVMRHRSRPEIPVPCTLPVMICASHKATDGLEQFLSDEGWAQFCRGFKSVGKLEPTRELTTLVWTLDPPENWAQRPS